MNHCLLRLSSVCVVALLVGCGDSGATLPAEEFQDTGVAETDPTSDATDGATSGDAPVVDGETGIEGDAPVASDADDAATTSDASDAASCETPIRCYPDADGDGYAKSEGSVLACTCPSGYTSTAPTSGTVDCNDENPNVHPGVTTYSDTPYCVPPGCSTKSFDYDCSGTEERQDTVVFTSCSSFLSGCSGAGWVGTVAGCGASADYKSCSTGVAVCSTSTASKKQKCR